MIRAAIYNQWGQPYSSKKLLPASVTIGSHGCFMTSLTMALPNFGIVRPTDGTFFDPGEVRDKLVAAYGFNAEGFLTYDGVERAFPMLHFYDRLYTDNDPRNNGAEIRAAAALKKVRRLLDLGQPTILAVDNIGNDGYPDHAVLAVDYTLGPDGLVKDFLIHDPDGGKVINFTSKYGPPLTKLYGMVVIIGSPIEYPAQSTDKEDGASLWMAAEIKKGMNVNTHARTLVDSFLST